MNREEGRYGRDHPLERSVGAGGSFGRLFRRLLCLQETAEPQEDRFHRRQLPAPAQALGGEENCGLHRGGAREEQAPPLPMRGKFPPPPSRAEAVVIRPPSND